VRQGRRTGAFGYQYPRCGQYRRWPAPLPILETLPVKANTPLKGKYGIALLADDADHARPTNHQREPGWARPQGRASSTARNIRTSSERLWADILIITFAR
jgi:hypothetical protein